ncbi:Aste57867_743 [Aphanomyces stellatus]|uniref:Aste57867_743 protein n=1 Tax=Aphanomyces stellatus TaxID=120398 RepID=A0A485K626_9STRA|nr:hypothetical protein As57867_000742 [Aphanomyces stellatus]VFT77967.1 Aste57867_743 [Aphanomyces stellatus]
MWCLAALFLVARAVNGRVISTATEGDLIQATIPNPTTVGVLLDEFPTSMHAELEQVYLAKDDAFWTARALAQADLAYFRLSFRPTYYENKTAGQMMLPDPKMMDISFVGDAQVVAIDGHHYVARNYTMSAYVVGPKGDAAKVDADLETVGGAVVETFVFPVDPELVMQRTNFSCMNEGQFPLGSLDAESMHWYFDDTCTNEVDKPFNRSAGVPCNQCHCTVDVQLNCVDAIQKAIGATTANVTFTHVAWDEAIASSVEAENDYDVAVGEPEDVGGANLVGKTKDLEHQITVYRYFKTNTCEAKEGCVKHPGWRRLVMFDATDVNVGSIDLEFFGNIGFTNESTFFPSLYHNLFYWFACHAHPHFNSYASFNVGQYPGLKQGFCIQSLSREVNSRDVSLVSSHFTCMNQGVTKGWSDTYNIGIGCQWVDITEAPPAKSNITIVTNPKGWVCEGTKVHAANGSEVFIPTGEKTDYSWGQTTPVGSSIDKWKCENDNDGANYKDNVDTAPFEITAQGEGALTARCLKNGQTLGPKRDCEFKLQNTFVPCRTPGQVVQLECSLPANAKPQVVRVCESSILLKSGTACRFNDENTLANHVLTAPKTTLSFTCPAARDAQEVGGYFSIYSGAVHNGYDNAVHVDCKMSTSPTTTTTRAPPTTTTQLPKTTTTTKIPTTTSRRSTTVVPTAPTYTTTKKVGA